MKWPRYKPQVHHRLISKAHGWFQVKHFHIILYNGYILIDKSCLFFQRFNLGTNSIRRKVLKRNRSPFSLCFPRLWEECCGSCGLPQCRTHTGTSGHLYRTAPQLSRASDKYKPPNSSQRWSACVFGAWLQFYDAPDAFHRMTFHSSDRISQQPLWDQCRRHTAHIQGWQEVPSNSCCVSIDLTLWTEEPDQRWMYWHAVLVFWEMLSYKRDTGSSDCCPSTCWGRPCKSCVHMVWRLDQQKHPDRSSTGTALQTGDFWNRPWLTEEKGKYQQIKTNYSGCGK